jgi:hypothetical protein
MARRADAVVVALRRGLGDNAGQVTFLNGVESNMEDLLVSLAEEDARTRDDLEQAAAELESILRQSRPAPEGGSAGLGSGPVPRLFGTSGIRGAARIEFHPDWYERLVRGEGLDLAMAYCFGRVLGQYLRERGRERVFLGRDVRASGPAMALLLAAGLAGEGLDVHHLGVVTTPEHLLYQDDLTVLVTASHNPPGDNGIKLFDCGAPASSALERDLEARLGLWGRRWREGSVPAPSPLQGRQIDARAAHRAGGIELLRAALRESGLLGPTWPLRGRVLPLDLARGAMAGRRRGDCLDPGLHCQVLLETGAALIIYGAEQDARRVNDRCGAAYFYGETSAPPAPEDLAGFVRGAGGPASGPRLVLLPGRKSRLEAAFPGRRTPNGAVEPCPVVGAIDATAWFLGDEVNLGLSAGHLLPAMSVDGDGDRILCSAPELLGRPEPYLSGDLFLRLLLAAAPPGSLPRLVWTYESGLSLEKHIEAVNQGRAKSKTVQGVAVNVGDRNVIKELLAAAQPGSVGAEPSGHIMLGSPRKGRFGVIDAPVAVYLRLLTALSKVDFQVGRAVAQVEAVVPEVACVRKPDAWGPGDKLRPDEQKALDFSHLAKGERRPTAYALEVLPFAVGQLLAALHALLPRQVPTCVEPPLVADWKERLHTGLAQGVTRDVEIARTDELLFLVRVTDEERFGPEVLYLSAWWAGEQPAKAAELVLRNSGTRPKNAGYVKIWPEHPDQDAGVLPERLQTLLQALAEARVRFTNDYVARLREKQLTEE